MTTCEYSFEATTESIPIGTAGGQPPVLAAYLWVRLDLNFYPNLASQLTNTIGHHESS